MERERAHKKQWRCHKCKQARKSKAKNSLVLQWPSHSSLQNANLMHFPRLPPPPPQSLLVSFVLKKKSKPNKEKKKNSTLSLYDRSPYWTHVVHGRLNSIGPYLKKQVLLSSFCSGKLTVSFCLPPPPPPLTRRPPQS
jgi:hypothetical protein